MDRAVPSDTSPGLIAGRLEGISVPDLVWALCKRRRTGVLRIRRAGIEKLLYLESGRIIFASSGDRNDRLGEQLLRRGVITLDQLDAAVERLLEGKRLGTLLVEAKHLTPEALVNGVIDQVKTIVLDQFAVDEGEYSFEDGELPTEEVITLNMRTNQLLLEGIRRVRSLSRIRRSIGKPSTVYSLHDDWEHGLDGVDLNEGEQLLLERLKGGDASVEALCDEMYLSNFEIFQSLWAFRVLGVIAESDFPGLEHLDDEPEEGHEAGFVEYLIRLCRARETGVLYASCGSVDRSFHLRQGQCIFATSSDSDDGLLAFLLRRGVISLRDREETAKRLLSNKRVGTILRELGVIDDNDLQEMVRQQLAEVVCDTFRWDRADCRFVPGPLPSNEEITLELNPETLVTAGLRRVLSWERVQRGCGGVDSVLALTPDYLNLLDAMAGGEEEWEVVTALKTPRTPREICRASKLGDFRVCQILWGLRVLGGVDILQEDVEDQPHVGAESLSEAEPPVESVEDSHHDEEPELEQFTPNGELPVVADRDVAEASPAPTDEEMVEEQTGQTSPIPRIAEAEQVDREPTIDEPDGGRSPDSTVQLSREELEAALSGPLEDDDRETEAPEPEASSDNGEPSLWEVEQSTRTVRLSREEVEAALAPGPDAADWAPPEDLERAISKFNAVQRVVYRTVRMEFGAGAANFIKACCFGESGADPLASSELLSDGSWDSEGLKQAIFELKIDDPWGEYQRVIEREIDLLREHIGETRAHELMQQVEELDQAGAAR